ncbi:hypothetical protein PR202_ga16666 [Eleusine coracana subsp. coracana]|uniref:Uncharacterized protein n=1 Tax=Eleusine coracana subsp. coracana TaxID=191504 RepID=A0AAV5CNH3_ELECO|nr:hypothetical protein PR202_ga16666 [Eleusine coracana subsp. coracana]
MVPQGGKHCFGCLNKNLLSCDVNNWVLSMNQVPKEWMLDPDWDMEPKQPFQMSYTRKFPSKWRSASGLDPINSVRIVDKFVIPRTPLSHTLRET